MSADQSSAESVPALIRTHRDVIQPAAPSVPAAERGRGKTAFVEREEEQSRVALRERRERHIVVGGGLQGVLPLR